MKSIITSFILIILSLPVNGQKHDNIWLAGITNGTGPKWIGAKVEFGPDTLLFESFLCPIYMASGQITISDAHGNLLFYTNGNYIVNRFHEIMPNGKALNQGSDFNDRSAGGNSSYFPYGYMVIPDKEDPDMYYLIHPQTKYPPHKHYQYKSTSDYLKCTRINMRLDGGNGDVDEREKIIYPVKSSDRYRIIQHGNGRDYWLLTKDNNGQYLHVLLFSRGEILQSEKIKLYDSVDYLHNFIDSNLTNQGLLDVANSGDFFVDYKGGITKVIYDFDRCTGEVSYSSEFYTPIDEYVNPFSSIIRETGRVCIGFSPSDRFYYCSSFGGFYQYDLESIEIGSSVVKLSGPPIVLDDNQDTIANRITSIPFSALGSNGKIYALKRRNHYIIHDPNQKGVACNFEGPKAFRRNIYFDAPLYPNYRMGPLKDSPCDSLSTSNNDRYDSSTFKVFPNPSSGPFTIELDLPEWDTEDVSVSIFDAIGRELYRHPFPKWAYRHEVDPGVLPPGAYLVRLEIGGAVVHTERVVVF